MKDYNGINLYKQKKVFNTEELSLGRLIAFKLKEMDSYKQGVIICNNENFIKVAVYNFYATDSEMIYFDKYTIKLDDDYKIKIPNITWSENTK